MRIHIDWPSVLRVIALVAICAFFFQLARERMSSPLKDKAAPDFTLQTDNEIYQLSKLRGRPVVLEFWAPWCAACRSTFAMVNALADTFSDQATFLGVNIETNP